MVYQTKNRLVAGLQLGYNLFLKSKKLYEDRNPELLPLLQPSSRNSQRATFLPQPSLRCSGVQKNRTLLQDPKHQGYGSKDT